MAAYRAVVYGAHVSASLFIPWSAPDNKKQSLGRANAAKFIGEFADCKVAGLDHLWITT